MRPVFVALVWAVAAAHFLFLAYLPTGGVLALRWPRTVVVHVAAVMWALGSVLLHFWCPLTGVEPWARAHAGMAPLSPAGFIDHYLTGVVYPLEASGYVQLATLIVVMASWLVYAVRRPTVRGIRQTKPRS